MCIKLRKMTGKNVRAAETELTSSAVHTNRNALTVVEGFCKRKTGTIPKNVYKFRSMQIRTFSSLGSNTVYLFFLF